VGGQTAQILAQPTSAYWDSVATRLRGHGSAPKQVQVVWLKDANANPTGTFEVTTDTLAAQFFRIVQILKQKLPNVRQVFFTSRIYAGYASTTLNPEPYAYENAFADHYLQDSYASGHMGFNRRASSAAAAKVFHDYWNRRGRVVSNRAGARWLAYGDGRLGGPGNCSRLVPPACSRSSAAMRHGLNHDPGTLGCQAGSGGGGVGSVHRTLGRPCSV
jgi:hypothetical protein